MQKQVDIERIRVFTSLLVDVTILFDQKPFSIISKEEIRNIFRQLNFSFIISKVFEVKNNYQ